MAKTSKTKKASGKADSRPKKQEPSIAEIGSFKGTTTFRIMKESEAGDDSAFPLCAFGLRKAKLILEHIEAIKAFVESDGESVE